MTKNTKFDFLLSVRFWKLGLAGLSLGLATFEQTGSWILAISAAVGSWATASVAVRTYDRANE